MPGAPWLAAQGASRAGAGLVTIATAESALVALAAKTIVQTLQPLPSTRDGFVTFGALRRAIELCDSFDAAVIGPGLSLNLGSVRFANAFIKKCPIPLVVDADGLNAMAAASKLIIRSDAPRVLTPHPGEAARLLSTDCVHIQRDRVGSAVAIARRFGAVAVLKGAGTIVTDGSRVFINKTGNPGLATGGSGDVLAGIVASFLARKMAPFEAAILSVYIHGRAGDLAAVRIGELGMIATDLLEQIPVALRERTRGVRV